MSKRIKTHRKKDKWDEYARLALETFIIAVSIFACIYLLDIVDTPSKLGIVNENNSKEWLRFSINYFGTIAASFISFIGAIMAVSMTIEKQNEFRKEDNRKRVLPIAKIGFCTKKQPLDGSNRQVVVKQKSSGHYSQERANTHNNLQIQLSNVGEREMYDARIKILENEDFLPSKEQEIAPIVYSKEASYFSMTIDAVMPKLNRDSQSDIVSDQDNDNILKSEITFLILYKDCYDNKYRQSFTIEVSYNVMRSKIAGKSYVFKDFENSEIQSCRVVSAPQKID